MDKTDTEMVERVAAVIGREVRADWTDQYRPNVRWPDDYSELEAALCRNAARAAIEAMRDPTEAMRKEGMRCMLGNLRPDEAYRHMIDAALGRQFPPLTASDPSQGSDTTETKNAAPEPIVGRPGASDGEGTP